MNLICKEHIVNSIKNAELNLSKLNNSALGVLGETGLKNRHFLNNLLEFPEGNNINYLEIGIKNGATLVSSLYKNKINSAYAVEIDKTNTSSILNLKELFKISFNFLNEDCFKLDLSKITNKINVYLFDGGHTYEDHYMSLKYYYEILDDQFIFIVDDWINSDDKHYMEWKQVSEATLDSISDLKLKISFEDYKKRINPQENNWWGGYWISILKK